MAQELAHAGVTGRLKLVIALALLLASTPIIMMYSMLVLSGFSKEIVTDPLLRDFEPTLENWFIFFTGRLTYAAAGLGYNVVELVLSTLIVALGVAVVATVSSMLAAYSLSRMDFKGRRIMLAGLILLHAFPGVAMIIGVYILYIAIGLATGLRGNVAYAMIYVILARAALEVPMATWLFKGFFDKIPWEVEWSALVDGASRITVWRKILVPMIKPGIAAVLIFTFLAGWEEFVYLWVFLKPSGIDSLPTFIEEVVASAEYYQLTIVAAAGTFYLLPTIIFFIVTQRLLLEAYSGGLKG